MIHILTSTSTILQVEVRPQESRIGDSNVEAVLNLKLKKALSNDSFSEQLSYLQSSATAAYVSLNKLDQRARFRCSVSLNAFNNQSFNFNQGSSSSGLGFALACFDIWWRLNLKKSSQFDFPIFTTGEILTSGQINPISQIHKKSESLCRHVEENRHSISTFYFCYPVENDQEIAPQLKERIKKLGGRLIACARLQEVLGKLLGKSYDGDPLGRWVPFKGLKSFDYEDSIRFFGRNKDVERLFDDINLNSGLLIISGASGTGKSSLIKAGLIPKLEKKYGRLSWATCTPCTLEHSVGILDFVILQLIQAWSLPYQNQRILIDKLNFSLDEAILFIESQVPNDALNCFIYLDQYEEVFNQKKSESKKYAHELSIINALATSLTCLTVVLGIRNDSLSQMLGSGALKSPTVLNLSSHLTHDKWKCIVHDQALFSGVTFENRNGLSLDEKIIDDALQISFSALPIVSFLLEQLYSKASDIDCTKTILKYEDYEELGGISGVIEYRASSIMKKYEGNRNLLFEFFDCFIAMNSEGGAVSKLVSLNKIKITDTVLYDLVNHFISANLIISSDNDVNMVKFATDSIFYDCKYLNHWISSNQNYLLWKNVIEPKFNKWKHVKEQHLQMQNLSTTPLKQIVEGRNNFKRNLEIKKLRLKNLRLISEGIGYSRQGVILDQELNYYLKEAVKEKLSSIGNFLFIISTFIILFLL